MIVAGLKIMRAPWKGLPQKSETAEAVEKEKMFEEISSYHGDFTNANNLMDESLMWKRNERFMTAETKRKLLESAYHDPFDELF